MVVIDRDVIFDKEAKKHYFKTEPRLFILEKEIAQDNSILDEFIALGEYLKKEPRFGVFYPKFNESPLNYVTYLKNEKYLKEKFPLVIDSLKRYYSTSKYDEFLKRKLNISNPLRIDLIGPTGAGKTTFIHNYTNTRGKEIINNTIGTSGNSTNITTSIVLLPTINGERMFLKTKKPSDLILNIDKFIRKIDLENEFFGEKDFSKKLVHKDYEINEIDLKIYCFVRHPSIIQEFKVLANRIQSDINTNYNLEILGFLNKWISYISEELNINNSFSYDDFIEVEPTSTIIDATILTLSKFKKKLRNDKNQYSLHFLFDECTLLVELNSDIVQNFKSIDLSFGILFKDSQGHIKDDQKSISLEIDTPNKLLLIPASNSGEIIDKEKILTYEKVLQLNSAGTRIIITKLDDSQVFKNEVEFENIESWSFDLKEQIVNTYNNIIEFNNEHDGDINQDVVINEKKIIDRALGNMYLTNLADTKMTLKVVNAKVDQNALDTEDIHISIVNDWYSIIKDMVTLHSWKFSEFSLTSLREEPMKLSQNVEFTKSMEIIRDSFLYLYTNDSSEPNVEKLVVHILNAFYDDFRKDYHWADSWYRNMYSKNSNLDMYDISTIKVLKLLKNMYYKEEDVRVIEKHLMIPLSEQLVDFYNLDRQFASKIVNELIDRVINKAVLYIDYVFTRHEDEMTSEQILNKVNTKQYGDYVNISADLYEKAFNYRKYNFNYTTYTEEYLKVYLNTTVQFTANFEKYFVEILHLILDKELENLHYGISN